MAKQDKHNQPIPEPEVDQEVINIMGPIPEDAAAQGNFVDAMNGDETTASGPPAIDDVEAPLTDEKSSNAPTVMPVSENRASDIPEPAQKSDIAEVAEEINASLAEQSTANLSTAATVAKKTESDELSDPTLDAAVKDIVATEGDQLLAAEDAQQQAIIPKEKKPNIIVRWWRNKRLRLLTIALFFGLILGLSFYPSSRYAVLNTVGVRAGIHFKVIDSKNGVPIKNVEVVVGGQKGITDDNGAISLSGVKLGKTQLVLTKRSFSPLVQTVIIGWGSNPYNDPLQMTPTGTAYSFTVTDWLSGKPIEKAEVSDGESTAVSDEKGIAILTVEPTDKDLHVTIKGQSYRVESIVISSTDKTNKAIKLVAGSPEVFVSKRSGRFDVYKRDVDGKNEAVLLPGTGSEQEPLGLLVSPDGLTAALVSTRDGKRDANGYLLSNLYMIDVQAKTVTKVAGTESAQIQLIDWVDNKLVFVKVAAGPSAATSGRQRITVYDSKQDKQTEISNANYYNDVEVYNGQVYYAPSSTGSIIGDTAQLYRVNTDNSAKTVLLNKEVWVTYRTAYDKLQISAADSKWYEQTIGNAKVMQLSGAPASPFQHIYVTNQANTQSAWVDNRDGKGVLIVRSQKDGTEKTLVTKGGLGYPVRWLSDKHILYRVSNSVETSDYIINIDGGEAVKVGDVTNTAATNRWYYYK
jgi:hypothetical protein